jgi:RnfABCDGE-type electron transport complex G subunit
MIRLTLVLAAVTFTASLALGFVYESAKPKIDLADKLNKERARMIALPEAACGVFVEEKGEAMTYYRGYREADTTGFAGYVVTAEGKGYSSTIETVVGVDPYGRIAGLRITSQQETPGLGTRIQEVLSTRTVADAIADMVGRGEPEKVCVDIEADTTVHCVEVRLRSGEQCSELEKAVAGRDTARVVEIVPAAFGASPTDSAAYLSDPASTFSLAEAVIVELRLRNTPWFLTQFIGKRAGNLLVRAEETDDYIQAITGATISSVAVSESVRDAIKQLGQEIGGFEEVSE